MKKKPPKFKDEDRERAYWAKHDSTEHVDWSKARRTAFPRLKPSVPLCVLALLVCGELVFADAPPTDRQMVILRTAMASHVDGTMHRDFWAEMPRGRPPEAFRKQLDQLFLLAQRYQMECWTSIKLSAQKGEIVRTQRLAELTEEVAKAFGGTPEGRRTLRNTESLLHAAATKKLFSDGTNSFYVTEDLADQSIMKIDAAIERVEILMSEVWPPRPKERVLERIGVKVNSAFPFTLSEEEIDLGILGTMRAVSAVCMIDDDSLIAVVRCQLPNRPVDEDHGWRMLNSAVDGNARGTGGKVVSKTRGTFRGMPSLTALIKVPDEEGDLFISVKVALDAENSHLYQMSAGSTTFPAAQEALDSLVLNIQLSVEASDGKKPKASDDEPARPQ